MSGFCYGSRLLDEQFRLAAFQLTGKFGMALYFTIIMPVTVANAYFAFYEEGENPLFLYGASLWFLAGVLFFNARRDAIMVPYAREFVHMSATCIPLVFTVQTFHAIKPNLSSADKVELLARLKHRTVLPVLFGILVRLPFWTHLLWSRLAILGYVIVGICRIVPTEQLPKEVLMQVFICAISLFVAQAIEQAHHENHRLRRAEYTTILGAVGHDLGRPILLPRPMAAAAAAATTAAAAAAEAAAASEVISRRAAVFASARVWTPLPARGARGESSGGSRRKSGRSRNSTVASKSLKRRSSEGALRV
jgi:hypothetical protein